MRTNRIGGKLSGNRPTKLVASLFALSAASGCVSFPQLQASPLSRPAQAAAPSNNGAAPERASNVEILSAAAPDGAENYAPAAAAASPEAIAALLEDREVQVSLPPQPVAQFIDTAFGEILRVPYTTGPGVAQRRDIIALRGPSMISSRRFFTMVQMALQQYGLAVVIENGGVRIVQDSVLSGQAPSFIRTRSAPETPASSRPVMQFFPVSSLEVDALLTLLNQAYPNRGSVTFTAQADTNTLLISGSARDVAAAASVVSQLDRPYFAGGQIARVEPVFMSADQLSDSLTRVLSAEGYRVSNPVEGRRGALNILPLPQANQLLIYSRDPALFERALLWVSRLDQASAMGDGEGVFVYTARNTNVEDLGALAAQSSGGASSAAPAAPPEVAVRRINGARVGSRQDSQPSPSTSLGNITIDASGNRILFRGTASEYAHIRELLEQLDTPQRQVLIELTIAEVTLTDETRYGVEWFLDQTISNGNMTANTRGGSTRQSGGLGVTATHIFSRGTVEAALNAFASNHNLNILSTPRLVTRSGRAAEILIGTDVPIITSQRASGNQTGGDTDVLQTVQYRQTGVILNVRPIVYGDDRVDIELYQEVSNQQPNTSSSINSPIILNRSVSTQLSLQEGMTAVIGGMIQDNFSREQRGIPGLKDLPFIGAAFRSEEVTGDKVELVILVTPYIIRDSDDMSALAETMSDSVNRTLRHRGTQVYTLYPWSIPFAPARQHLLSPPARASGAAMQTIVNTAVSAAPGNAPAAAAPEVAPQATTISPEQAETIAPPQTTEGGPQSIAPLPVESNSEPSPN